MPRRAEIKLAPIRYNGLTLSAKLPLRQTLPYQTDGMALKSIICPWDIISRSIMPHLRKAFPANEIQEDNIGNIYVTKCSCDSELANLALGFSLDSIPTKDTFLGVSKIF
jgi:hypothetical protein